jgi:tetratricopeptide (TPR) repeat protein
MNKVAKVAVAGAVAMVLAGTLSGRLLPGYVASAAAEDAKPAADSAPKPQVSKEAGKDLQEAQKDMQAQKWDDMLVVLQKVKDNPKKNDYDEHVMNEFYITAYANKKQLKEATGPLEFLITSKFTPPDELKKREMQAAFLYYQLQNYDKAVEYGNRAIKDGSATDQVHLVVAQSYYLKNDFKDTDQFVSGLVDDQIKAGTAPSDDILQLGLSSAVKLNDEAGEARWLELEVTYHPTAERWQNVLDGLFRTKMTDRQLLQVYRLSVEVGALKRGSDYAEMAQLALDAGSPGEAVSVLTKGFADNAFTDQADKNRNQHLLDSAKKQAAADQPTLAKAEGDAAGAAGGDKLVGAGIGYFGYGEYDKAAKDIAAGLAKGATKDAENARLLLGIAQFKAGSKDEAVKTFSAVKGDAILQHLARLWTLHVKAPVVAAT